MRIAVPMRGGYVYERRLIWQRTIRIILVDIYT